MYFKCSLLTLSTSIGIKNHSSCLIKFCLLKVLFAWHTKYTRQHTHCFTSILLLHILCHRYIYDFIYYVIGMTYTRLCHRWLMFLNWLINAVVLPQTEKKLCSPSQSSTTDLAFGSLIHHEGWCYTVGPNSKNPPKIRSWKCTKMTNSNGIDSKGPFMMVMIFHVTRRIMSWIVCCPDNTLPLKISL